jgi:probable F420-dependent oxidoreductase
MTPSLGPYGAFELVANASPSLAAGLEAAGYGALWVGGSPGGDLTVIEDLLDATTHLVVATGIVNIWRDDAGPTAAAWHRIAGRHPDRFLLGIGVGHPESTGARYARPYQALVDYLDELDREAVPKDQRVLAALGPRVLKLAADRSAGAHPYLTTPAHTRSAREVMGEGPLLAPVHKAVLDEDPDRARALGRPAVAKPYLSLVNYLTNLRRLGYSDADLTDGGSDRLVDDLVTHGTPEQVAVGLRAHLDAGADHVAVHLLVPEGGDRVGGYTSLAPALGLANTTAGGVA